MVLKRPNTPTTFEAMEAESAVGVAEPTPEVAAPVSTPTRAVAAVGNTALANRAAGNINAITELKGAYTVQYDSLAQILAAQGTFTERESDTNMGSRLVFELMSYQEQFVVSPNDDKASKELVRYSADGKVCSDGTDVQEHLKHLRDELNYKNARVNSRYILVGALVSAERTKDFDGQLMQIDLSPKSRGQFDRYRIQSAYDIGKGKFTADESKVLEMTAEVATNGANQKYTLVKFATFKEA